MQTKVLLTASHGPVQRTLIEEVLKEARIPFETRDPPSKAIIGEAGPVTFVEFVVPPERLQEAKELLCANDIVCEVSGRLLSKALEDIVKPLMAAPERDFGRLKRFIEVNNKETVKALFEETLKISGGRELLEELFFQLANEGNPRLPLFARVLSQRVNAAFVDRYQTEVTHGSTDARIALLGALPELPPSKERARILATALLDKLAEVREAASEALFALGLGDYGYDPEDSPAVRESAVMKFLAASGVRGL